MRTGEDLEAFVSHPNAALTPRARLRLARLIVEQNWRPVEAAKLFMVAEKVAEKTARKWAQRYRDEGAAGMALRGWHCGDGRPRLASAYQPEPDVRTRGAAGCRINRLSRIDRVTGEPLRRYEHDHPGKENATNAPPQVSQGQRQLPAT